MPPEMPSDTELLPYLVAVILLVVLAVIWIGQHTVGRP